MAKQQKDSILIERFWDMYDFTDTIRLSSSATTEKMLVDYLSQLSELTRHMPWQWEPVRSLEHWYSPIY